MLCDCCFLNQEVEEYYQDANIGDLIEVCFDDDKPVDVTPGQQMDGWDINVHRIIFPWNYVKINLKFSFVKSSTCMFYR